MNAVLSSADFIRIAEQQAETADFLIERTFTKHGMYFAGYVTECAMKALILFKTPEAGRESMFARISKGATMHEAETLAGILNNESGIKRPLVLVRKHRRMGWYTGLRYEWGRADIGEARGVLKTGRLTLEWAKEQMK